MWDFSRTQTCRILSLSIPHFSLKRGVQERNRWRWRIGWWGLGCGIFVWITGYFEWEGQIMLSFKPKVINFQYLVNEIKGVSDLETSMGYFVIPWRSYWSLNFCFPAKTAWPSELQNWEASVVCPQKVFERLLNFSQQDGKIQIFTISSWKWKIIHSRF